MSGLLGFFLVLLLPIFSSCQNLNIYSFPGKGFDHGSDVYQLHIKQGLQIKESYVYVSYAGTDRLQKEWGFQQNKTFHYTIFSFSGAVTIVVTKMNSVAKTATVRPSGIGIGTIRAVPKSKSRSVSFKIAHPGKFSVEFDDDPNNKEAFMIFADTTENRKDVPDLGNKEVWKVQTADKNIKVPLNKSIVYFEPGIYETGYFQIPQHVKQVYIAGGAFVRGYFFASRKNNSSLQINGRGILSNDRWPYHYPVNTNNESDSDYRQWYRMIKITGGSHHRIEGITFVDPSAVIIAIYSSHHNTVENIKVNAFRYNNDAVNLHGDSNTINNCFFRSNEDVISISGNNTIIKNCSFWQLHNGSIIQLGWRPHNIGGENLIENCFILHAEWDNNQNHNIGFINVMNVSAPESAAVIENITLKNIYADTEILRFVDFRMLRNGRGQPLIIRNINFKNIHLKSKPGSATLFYMSGFDATHTISNINFSKIYINNEHIKHTSLKNARIFEVNNFSEAPVFKQ